MSKREHCKDCSDPAESGKVRCARCAEFHSIREAARREARRLAGSCIVCGEAAVVDVDGVLLAHCDEHRHYYAVRRVATAKAKRRAKSNQGVGK